MKTKKISNQKFKEKNHINARKMQRPNKNSSKKKKIDKKMKRVI